MLSRAQRRHRHNDIEHLVIELKAPKVVRNGPDPQRRLIQKGERVMVGVKTWGRNYRGKITLALAFS
jgi:hypothetical protein